MEAEVSVTVNVKIRLQIQRGDDTTIGEMKEIAKKSAAQLVTAGLYYANREVKGFSEPRLAGDGDSDSRKTWPVTVGEVVIR